MCVASTPALAAAIVDRCPGLGIRAQRAAKALGGTIGTGKNRSVAPQRQRLVKFKARLTRFQKLRRLVGADAVATVLRTGGTAALVYGQANMGVSPTFLHAQRVAVASSSVPGGSGDLDLMLAVADGSAKGQADPAFSAHLLPICKWAQAVWHGWLALAALQALLKHATSRLAGKERLWSLVHGPAAAFLATAWRIGWQATSATTVVDELGVAHDLLDVPPARIAKLIHRAVTTWRWRRVETKHPHLRQAGGGHRPFIEPIRRLLGAKASDNWGPSQRGALRSAFLNRQWTQARLFQAGRAASPTCQLCVALNHCHDGDRSPQFAGTLLHRVLSCAATAEERRRKAPEWILRGAQRYVNNGYSLDAATSDLLTRGLLPSPAPRLSLPPSDASFRWIVEPPDSGLPPCCTIYVDGSRLYGEHKYFGLCARQAWSFLVLDSNGRFVASAAGTPPGWAEGIHATELWGVWQALQNSGADDDYRTDCLAVKLGADKGITWACAAERIFGQVWSRVAEALHGRLQNLAWMPAHCSAAQVGRRFLSNGSRLSRIDLVANDYVDRHAKAEAKLWKPPRSQLQLVVAQGKRLTEAATWLGQVTSLANHFALPRVEGEPRTRHARDSAGKPPTASARGAKRKRQPEVVTARAPGNLSLCPRWAALRARILAKTAGEVSEVSL